MQMQLKIVTPASVVFDQQVDSVTLPGTLGEMTILPKHMPLFSSLEEGVVLVRTQDEENAFSIGGGYVETDGDLTTVLVSRAYNQDEIDEQEVLKAQKDAEKLVTEAKTDEERHQALSTLRRTIIDLKVLKKVKRKRRV